MDIDTKRTEHEMEGVRVRLAPQLEEAREKLSELNTRTAAFIKERPIACLAGAAAAGYLIGRIASRR